MKKEEQYVNFGHILYGLLMQPVYTCLCVYRCRQVHMVRYSEILCADRAFIFITCEKEPSVRLEKK